MRVVACSGGGQDTMAIDEHGQMWGCGRNVCGQLGLGNTQSSFSMARIPFAHEYVRPRGLAHGVASAQRYWCCASPALHPVPQQRTHVASVTAVCVLMVLATCAAPRRHVPLRSRSKAAFSTPRC